MVESILDEGTVAVGTSMDFWKSLRRSNLEVINVDLGGGRRLWRQEAGSKMLWKQSRDRADVGSDRKFELLNDLFEIDYRCTTNDCQFPPVCHMPPMLLF